MIEHKLSRNVHDEPRVVLELVGSHEIFRFAVNMLDDQVEFAAAGRVIIVELREMVGAEKFDPWAKSLLGEPRYDRLSSYFERDTHCISCERDLKPDESRRLLANAAIACEECS